MRKELSEDILRESGLRATGPRIALLDALRSAGGLFSAETLHGRVPDMDLVTVYRTLQHFVAKDLVREVQFKKGAAQYEFSTGAHHHHLVCTSCGVIEELPACDIEAIEHSVLKNATTFASINDHTLEFFGSCRTCAGK